MKRFMFLLTMGLLALSIVTTNSTFASKLPKDIVFLMTFDESKGNKVVDLSGNKNDGEIIGKADWIKGKYSGGLHFDGSTHVTVPNAGPLKELTHPMSVGAWVNPDSLGGWRNIVEMDGGAGWNMGFHDSRAIVWTTYHVKDFIGQTAIETNKWTHVAATWDGKQALIYVNGEEDKGGPIPGGGVIDVKNEPSLDIGFRRTSNASFFIGGMDELWISNKVKTKKEIQEFMNGFGTVEELIVEEKRSKGTVANVKAQLYPYISLCKFPDSKNWPRTIRWEAGTSITVTGCSDLEKTLGHPSAIRVTIVNLSDSDVEIPIEGFNSVILTKKDSKKIPAIAWRFRQRDPLGSGYSFGFATECSGKIVVIIEPQESCDLIFLFPSAKAGELISIAGLAPVKITE